MDPKKEVTVEKEVYGPSLILNILDLLKEQEELLNDKEEYRWQNHE